MVIFCIIMSILIRLTEASQGLQYFVSGWASRVYFSDNGSTANEIALKMAFRKFLFDHNILVNPVRNNAIERFINLKVSFQMFFTWIYLNLFLHQKLEPFLCESREAV